MPLFVALNLDRAVFRPHAVVITSDGVLSRMAKGAIRNGTGVTSSRTIASHIAAEIPDTCLCGNERGEAGVRCASATSWVPLLPWRNAVKLPTDKAIPRSEWQVETGAGRTANVVQVNRRHKTSQGNTHMDFQYVWAFWSSAFLLPWLGLWLFAPTSRTVMWRVSLATMPFGLTEPLFVPAYWNPPSLFDLAQRTGFDLESLVFCFAIGGVGSVLYNVITRRLPVAMGSIEHERRRHRWHRAALFLPFVVFVGLYWLPWNPIYPAIIAMASGGAATALCRPDLARKSLVGGCIFLGFYAVFMATLLIFVPGYIEQVWNIPQLTGIAFFGIPMEELLFGLVFGVYWTSVYEHLTWRSLPLAGRAPRPAIAIR